MLLCVVVCVTLCNGRVPSVCVLRTAVLICDSMYAPVQVTDDSEAAVDATSDAGAAAAAQAASDSNTIGISNAGAGIRLAAHDLSIFRVHCRCADCLKYRETLIQLFLEDFEYNTLWKRLQLLVRRFYDLVPEK